MKYGDGVGAFEFAHGAFDGVKQITVVHTVHPMRDHFSVGLTGEHIAFGLQLGAQFVVVFNDAVVHQGHATCLVFQALQTAGA